jgi:hypothetical protein
LRSVSYLRCSGMETKIETRFQDFRRVQSTPHSCLGVLETNRLSPGRRSFLYSLPCCTIGWQPARIMLTSFNWPMAQVNGGLMNCFQSGSLQRTLAKFTPNTSHPVIKGVFPPFDANSCYGHFDPFRSFEKGIKNDRVRLNSVTH